MSRELKFICETWLPAPDYEESYEVSNFGNVRSIDRVSGARRGLIKGQLLKSHIDLRGYLKVRLYKDSKYTPKSVHRLVARAFISNPDSLSQINHIDGDKLNNYADNLEWTDNSGNQLHAYRNNLQPSRQGIGNGRVKLTDSKVTEFKLLYNSGKSTREAAVLLGINLYIARQIVSNRIWKSNKTAVVRRDERCKPTFI